MKLSDKQFSALTAKLALGSPDGGGFSANPKTGRAPRSGVMVSEDGTEQQVPARNVNAQSISEYARSNRGKLAKEGRYLGGWNPGGGADVSLDVSRRVAPSRSTSRAHGSDVARADAVTSALDLGIANRQEAVYDVKRDKVVATGYDPSKRRQ